MDGLIHLTKLDAARRQLHVAIQLLFDDVYPVAVHTLVGAASVIISDLVEQQHPHKSWDKLAQEANKITPSKYFNVMRTPQNFLKHAKEDAASTFDFDPNETEHLAFWTVMNLGAMGALSIEESVLQLWFFACHAQRLDDDYEPYKRAIEVFGDLRNSPRSTRLSVGKRILAEQQTSFSNGG
jgi:hypothetical protein